MTVFYLTDAIQCNNLHCHWRWYCPFILLHRFQQWTYYCERYPYKGQFSNLHCKKYFHFPLLKIHRKYIYMYVCGNVNGLQCFIRFFANKHKYDGRIILKWNTYRIYPPHLFLKLVLFCFLSNIHCNKTQLFIYHVHVHVCLQTLMKTLFVFSCEWELLTVEDWLQMPLCLSPSTEIYSAQSGYRPLTFSPLLRTLLLDKPLLISRHGIKMLWYVPDISS